MHKSFNYNGLSAILCPFCVRSCPFVSGPKEDRGNTQSDTIGHNRKQIGNKLRVKYLIDKYLRFCVRDSGGGNYI
jgi:hypothetical protein